MQYSCELLIRLLSDGNALGYYAKQETFRLTMLQLKHQATRRTKMRTRRSGEFVAALCDLKHCAVKFVMVEFPLVLWIFHPSLRHALCDQK